MSADLWSSLRESLAPVLSNPWVLLALAVAVLVGSVIVAFTLSKALDNFRSGYARPWVYRLTGHKRRLSRALNRERRNQPGQPAGGTPVAAPAKAEEPDTKASS